MDNMAEYYQIAIFTACQAGKNANIAPVLTLADIYGSAMLGKKAAVVLGCAATPEMKKNNLNNFMICKSRISGNGMMWENVTFDKDTLEIQSDDPNSIFNEKIVKEEEKFEQKYNEDEIMSQALSAHPLQGINLN
jgi:hypothetical protein